MLQSQAEFSFRYRGLACGADLVAHLSIMHFPPPTTFFVGQFEDAYTVLPLIVGQVNCWTGAAPR
jgi:hypothetical protein